VCAPRVTHTHHCATSLATDCMHTLLTSYYEVAGSVCVCVCVCVCVLRVCTHKQTTNTKSVRILWQKIHESAIKKK
jgi:hypothetical protein